MAKGHFPWPGLTDKAAGTWQFVQKGYLARLARPHLISKETIHCENSRVNTIEGVHWEWAQPMH